MMLFNNGLRGKWMHLRLNLRSENESSSYYVLATNVWDILVHFKYSIQVLKIWIFDALPLFERKLSLRCIFANFDAESFAEFVLFKW